MPEIRDLITASSYNALRSKINKVLGTGDNEELGYGQTLSSNLKADNDVITAQDMQDLYNDLVLAGKHQTGDPVNWHSVTANSLNSPDSGEVIGIYAADVGPGGTSLDAADDLDEGFLDFEEAANQIEANPFSIGAGALTTTVAAESIRTSAWKSVIDHVVTVTWENYEARRTWANAGGKIVFNASLTGGTSQPGVDETNTPPGTKDEIWQTMLSTMGTISIGVQGASTTGTGTAEPNASIIYSDRLDKISWEVTNPENRVEIFRKSGSGVYSENAYRIEAYNVADKSMRFRIRFEDNDLGDNQAPGDPDSRPIDENVTGTVISTISLVTPNGFLTHPVPVVTTDSNL